MNSTSKFDSTRYRWKPQPATARFVQQRLQSAKSVCDWLNRFEQKLRSDTGTRLIDLIDVLYVDSSDGLAELGYVPDEDSHVFLQGQGIFPTVVVRASEPDLALGLKVESLSHFLAIYQGDVIAVHETGHPGDALRIAEVQWSGGGRVQIIERHGCRGFQGSPAEERVVESSLLEVLETFRHRDRNIEDPQSAFRQATAIFHDAEDVLGKHRACDLFFRAEREFWQARNRAGQIQHQRQQAAGIGWANHDHHTYRCSREWFAPLVQYLERMGFHCRERFYAGRDAGWGAQVLEHPQCGIVVFADVDLSEEEITGDFAHNGLSPRTELGTVGLWCRLHGDSFLAAGMHHLECQFDFDAARAQLATEGIETMAPFTDFPYLRQAFTRGERWHIPASRLTELETDGTVTQEEALRFRTSGVIGSHLEILERNDGYKGFNQSGVSKIILETNPKTTQ